MRKFVLTAVAATLFFVSGCCPATIKALEDNNENWKLYGNDLIEYINKDPELNDKRKKLRTEAVKEAQKQGEDLVKAAKGEL